MNQHGELNWVTKSMAPMALRMLAAEGELDSISGRFVAAAPLLIVSLDRHGSLFVNDLNCGDYPHEYQKLRLAVECARANDAYRLLSEHMGEDE